MTKWHEHPPLNASAPVMALAFHQGSLWAAGVGGLARFDGAKWHPAATTPPLSSISALCSAGDLLVAGGPEGLARTSDRSASWQLCLQPGEVFPVGALAALPTTGGGYLLLAGTYGGGILRSENGGMAWEPAGEGAHDLEVLSLAARADGKAILAATTGGVYYSDGEARLWQPAAGCTDEVVTGVTFLADGDALATLETGEILKSCDGGQTWEEMDAQGLPEDEELSAIASAADGSLFTASAAGTLRSTDGGATWQVLSERGALAFQPEGQILYIGLADGVAQVSGRKWSPMPAPPLHDLRLLLLVGKRVYLAGLHSGLWTRQGGKWETIATPGEMVTAAAVAADGGLVVAGPDGIFRSENGGQDWSLTFEAPGLSITHLVFSQEGAGCAASPDGTQLVVTQDGGRTWRVSPPPGLGQLAGLGFSDGMLALAMYDIEEPAVQFWSSPENNTDWHAGMKVNTNWPAVSFLDRPAVISMAGTVIVQQPDGNWRQYQVGQEGAGVARITGDEHMLFALTTIGMFTSADQGKTWKPIADAPPVNNILDLRGADGHLYLLLTTGEVIEWINE